MEQSPPHDRLRRALIAIDAANAEDPRSERVDGSHQPKELLYAERLTDRLLSLVPQPSEGLQLAARAQHLRRWQIPRSEYPQGRRGYHRWRTALMSFHAEQAGTLLREVGYEEAFVARVQALIQKRNLATDPEAQQLEDAVCLVFLEHYFGAFAEEHADDKLVRILRRTWAKMSPAAHVVARQLVLGERESRLLAAALAPLPSLP